MGDSPALTRFAAAPTEPPPAVAAQLGAPGLQWSSSRVGNEGAYPNGGIWRYRTRSDDDHTLSTVVKRTGPQFLGGDPIWAHSLDPAHPMWWGREAAFYASDLSTRGWSQEARVARCFGVDDGPAGTVEIWLEDVEIPSLSIDVYRDVVRALASWQVVTTDGDQPFLSRGWIPSHLQRRNQRDNHEVAVDPRWQELLRHGIGDSLRHALQARITDPRTAGEMLGAFPQVLTNYDLHHANIGRANSDGMTAIIDWAFVGWGPIGQDVAHLAFDIWDLLTPAMTLQEVWDDLAATYLDALYAAGWAEPAEVVLRSMTTAFAVRHGWVAEYLLEMAADFPDEMIPATAARADFLAACLQRID